MSSVNVVNQWLCAEKIYSVFDDPRKISPEWVRISEVERVKIINASRSVHAHIELETISGKKIIYNYFNNLEDAKKAALALIKAL